MSDLLDRQDPNQYYAKLSGRMRCADMSMDEIQATLLGNCNNRSEVYSPKNLVRPPIQGRRWFAYLTNRCGIPSFAFPCPCMSSLS